MLGILTSIDASTVSSKSAWKTYETRLSGSIRGSSNLSEAVSYFVKFRVSLCIDFRVMGSFYENEIG